MKSCVGLADNLQLEISGRCFASAIQPKRAIGRLPNFKKVLLRRRDAGLMCSGESERADLRTMRNVGRHCVKISLDSCDPEILFSADLQPIVTVYGD